MKYLLPIFLIFGLIVSSCSKEEIYQSDHFFVESEGATMPVILKGDINADVFVIFLHGGPGANAITASYLPAFQELSEQYTIAYWEQRGSGLSQGNPDKSTFTVDQFTEDLDLVVDAIISRYSPEQIFLFGHSWGGALGGAYLSTSDYQEKITGFINMDSGHNLLEGLPKSVEWMKNYAQNQIDSNTEISLWTEVRDWCDNKPDMTKKENFDTYVGYIRQTNAYRVDNDNIEKPDIGFNDIFNSYMSLSVFFNGKYLQNEFNILELNLTPQLEMIATPTLVVWGKHDGINTIEMGYDAYNAIGGPNFTEKELVILENSAHEGYLEEKELFTSAFSSFVDSF